MVVLAILRPNLRPHLGIEILFFSIFNSHPQFFGEFYRGLLYRWIHSVIISESRSKVEKPMKNLVFPNFDCDAEIIVEFRPHYPPVMLARFLLCNAF